MTYPWNPSPEFQPGFAWPDNKITFDVPKTELERRVEELERAVDDLSRTLFEHAITTDGYQPEEIVCEGAGLAPEPELPLPRGNWDPESQTVTIRFREPTATSRWVPSPALACAVCVNDEGEFSAICYSVDEWVATNEV